MSPLPISDSMPMSSLTAMESPSLSDISLPPSLTTVHEVSPYDVHTLVQSHAMPTAAPPVFPFPAIKVHAEPITRESLDGGSNTVWAACCAPVQRLGLGVWVELHWDSVGQPGVAPLHPNKAGCPMRVDVVGRTHIQVWVVGGAERFHLCIPYRWARTPFSAYLSWLGQAISCEGFAQGPPGAQGEVEEEEILGSHCLHIEAAIGGGVQVPLDLWAIPMGEWES
ncbi:hypothetical protein OF83DRAFT_1172280 [Amylostereum chailletii]|nr:hypothetical protein OF83DRAFT_1172280 [Amylostereum chailletii]